MSGIDFSKFSNGFKALWNKAVSDGVLSVEEQSKFDGNDLSIFYQMYKDSPEDFKGLKIERVAAQKSNSTLYSYIIDGEEYTEGTLDLKDKEKVEKVYHGADSAKLKNGIVTLYDESEKVLTDAFGNPIRIDFSSGMKIDTSLEKVQGGFEKIENEDFQRTNRRFTIALIKTMFNRAIIANQQELDKLGLLDMRTWREIAGEGIQRLADSISEQQDMITANTMKRIERLKGERDAIIGKLEPLLDKPSSFAEEFSKLLGCSYQSTGMDNLRTTCFDEKSEKDGEIRYNKTVEGFKELYPENKVVKYLEGNSATKVMGNIASFCDSVADILAMFMLTGGIGITYKTLGTTFKTFGKTLGKATLKNFTKTSELFIKNVVNKNYKAAIAQFSKLSTFLQGAVHSAATMSTYEGGKALINSTTNGEDLTDDEILSRTINGFISGAEMGVEMAGLQTFAIAPIMNKLSPVLGKMTGASSKIKELLKKNGEMSLEDISKVYEDCIQTTRGKIAQEGLHLGVSLPIMVPGFTGIDSAKAFLSNGDKSYNEDEFRYNEDEFREQLLHNAKTQEERVRISAMNSFELKVEFVKRNFQAQLEGMTTIEGVSLALRRFQAARLAGQAVPKPVNNLLGAKIKTVEKDGKPSYEVVQENGKTLKFDMDKGGNVSQFSSPERAIAAYQAMCVKIMSEFKTELENADNTPNPNTQGAREQGDVRTESAKKPYIKPKTAKNNYTMSEPLLASEVSTETTAPKANNILDKVLDNTTIEQTKAIITKYCSENGLVIDDILSIFNKYTKDLDNASVERLLELASENKINLFSSQKEKMFLSFKRHCNEHSLSVNAKGILNYLKEGDKETTQFLKELLTLEKQGKIKPKNINEMLKLYTYDDDFNSFTEQCRLLAQKLQSGEILDAQIRNAIFFIENESPLEILNPKNISKYTKNDLREWSAKIQGADCKGLATETFNAINRELASLVKINKVPVNISQKFSSQFNNIMNIFSNNNFSIEKLAKAGGIKLQYSRDSFKSDIFNEIKHLSPIEQEKILSKFGLSKNSENILSGLPVEISSNSLNNVEQAINNHIHKFLSKENKIVLPKGFEELHPVIESICNAIPEFRFTIQAQQHNVQKYNLAEHMLKAFQENMKNPMYKELRETDKRILGIATLLHDINKIERTKFDQHALPSSQTVNAIVERIPNLTPMEKNRIVNLVKYHHWLTDISEKENPTLVKKLTEVFRGGNDFKLARIFAESDLKAVNDSFYTNYGEKLNYSMINEIEEAILALQSKSRMMFTASVNTEKALEKGAKLTTIGEGREATSNIVIDANQMGLDKEFFAYHGAEEQGLMTVFASGGYDKGLGLSISTGKNGVCKVFQDYEVFAIFDKLDMNAIGKVSAGNANTKYGKGIDKILGYMNSDSKFVTKFRKYYPHQITEREYALVFREIQGLELSEVSKNKNIIKILGDANKALDFEKALESTNQFFASSVESHNELVAFDLYPTAVGIKCKLENLSFEFRKFLQDNNIVIINNIK